MDNIADPSHEPMVMPTPTPSDANDAADDYLAMFDDIDDHNSKVHTIVASIPYQPDQDARLSRLIEIVSMLHAQNVKMHQLLIEMNNNFAVPADSA